MHCVAERIAVSLGDLVTKSHSDVLVMLERKSQHDGSLNAITYRAVEISDGGCVLVLEISATPG
jgi:hypothetical protein